MRLLVAALLAVVGAACGGGLPRHRVLDAGDDEGYPCVLHDPAALTPDFMVRQHLRIDARGKHGELDAVLQKQGASLTIVGLGPMDERAFTLTQTGRRIEFTQRLGPELPFSPRVILVDVHRVYFKALPAPPAGEMDGEHVEERWEADELRARAFTRPGFRGAVRIDYGPGCRRDRCLPERVTLRNEWFGYTLAITSQGYEAL